ncbi:VacJ family lipoprotein [Glaciecola sp. XM2]|uniref:MlaA family lipoprotein n=1 Tax=Glaciecola sp. XM2 TaxID=1914931 RepID=UPI00331D3C0E
MKVSNALLLLIAVMVSGCAANPQAQVESASNESAQYVQEDEGVSDPFEPINRVMWDFNRNVLDRFLVKPATQVYVAVMPQPVRTGLLNASENIAEPANAINNLLQGKPTESFASTSRFLINTTVGVLGIFDVAESMGVPRQEEDFNQVLGVWGFGTGPYLMLPALGPSDVRDFVGTYVDRFYWPETVLEDPYTISAAVVGLLETRATLLDQEANLERSLDEYLFVRDAYFQRVAFEVSDGEITERSQEEIEQEADDFEDFESLFEDIP